MTAGSEPFVKRSGFCADLANLLAFRRVHRGCEHDWRVIYTDDDKCLKCGAVRLWPSGEIWEKTS